jgi:hypothetical protein
MTTQHEEDGAAFRRKMLKQSAASLPGGAPGGAVEAYADTLGEGRLSVHDDAGHDDDPHRFGFHRPGALCGTLGGTALVINLAASDGSRLICNEMVDRLFHWYAEQEFPTDRFADISAMPGQSEVKAMPPLCPTDHVL